MSAKCSPYMHGAPYIFYFVHSIVKTVEMMVQMVNFEQNLKNICPATVLKKYHSHCPHFSKHSGRNANYKSANPQNSLCLRGLQESSAFSPWY